MIVQRKVLKAAEVFATTVKRWSQGKNINQKTTLLIWRLPFWIIGKIGIGVGGLTGTYPFGGCVETLLLPRET
jgi:hypothetical protein